MPVMRSAGLISCLSAAMVHPDILGLTGYHDE
jgi:hypothetical protein